jgi:hypothetical protein
VGEAVATLSAVMRGLDPRIHQTNSRSSVMDRRVKPGDDSVG